MQISNNGLNLITQFEGLRLEVYLDSASIPTIGYGTTYYEDGSRVSIGDPPLSKDRAISLLEVVVNKKAHILSNAIKVPINQNEFDAICSWCYNVGEGNAVGSTLLKLLNAGSDRSAVADQFLKWDKAGGNVIPGLTQRRQAERSLFLQPVVESNTSSSEDVANQQLKAMEDEIMKS